jgi:hypothetical protein
MPSTSQETSTPKDSGGTALTNRVITYQSSNVNVATVTNTGLISSVAVGTCTVTGTCEGHTATCAVTVVNANTVDSIALTPTTATVGVGSTTQLNAVPQDSGGNPVSATIAWSSSDASKATVDQNGLVTGVAQGAANITATVGAVVATCVITVPSTSTVRQLWFEADTISGLTDGALVSSWTDQVASIVASQATNFNKPTYRASAIGGLPAVDFELNAILHYADIDAVQWTRFFTVTPGTSTPSADMYLLHSPGCSIYIKPTGAIEIDILKSDGATVLAWRSPTAAIPLNVAEIIEVILDTSALTNVPVVKVNGTATSALTVFGGSTSGTRHSEAGTTFLCGDSGESREVLGPLASYVKIASVADQTAERDRLGTKYGIAVS